MLRGAGPGPRTLHRTPTYRCLDVVFALETSDPALARGFDRLYGGCRADADAPTVFSIVEQGAATVLSVDGSPLATVDGPSVALARTVWEINRRVQDGRSQLLLHAAAAARGDAGVVLSAPADAGKSTLVTALVRAGLAFVTDEVVAIDPRTRRVHAYPRPIGLDPGSWPLFPELAPDPALERYSGLVRYVAPSSIGAVARAPVRPALVLLPRYVPGVGVECSPVPRAEALLALADQSFNFATMPGALRVLAEVVRDARCYRIAIDDLDRACAAIEGLLDGTEDG